MSRFAFGKENPLPSAVENYGDEKENSLSGDAAQRQIQVYPGILWE